MTMDEISNEVKSARKDAKNRHWYKRYRIKFNSA
jgi:hypothetical protein